MNREEKMKGIAFRRVCEKGVLVGLAITFISFGLEVASAFRSDLKLRKNIKKQVNA